MIYLIFDNFHKRFLWIHMSLMIAKTVVKLSCSLHISIDIRWFYLKLSHSVQLNSVIDLRTCQQHHSVTSQTNSSQRFNSTFPIDISEHCPCLSSFCSSSSPQVTGSPQESNTTLRRTQLSRGPRYCWCSRDPCWCWCFERCVSIEQLVFSFPPCLSLLEFDRFS